MLIFLRKIRRKLLRSNKVVTYLLYGIGEIFLVVIGILIAVQIDDYVGRQKIKQQEGKYLQRLIDENQQDLKNFSKLTQDTKIAMRSIEEFCEALKDESASDSIVLAAVNQYMIYGSIVPIFNSSRSTFDDLSSTGNLKVISNDPLRNKIVEHYAEIEKVQERLRINSDWALALDVPFYHETNGMKYVPTTADLFPEESKQDLAKELRKNKMEYINNASVGYWVDLDAVDLLNELSTKTTRLILAMENEIGVVTENLPDPLQAGWNGEKVCEVVEENSDLRILKCAFPPGVGHEKHYHPPHVGYTLAGGKFEITDSTGTRTVEVPEGYVFPNENIQRHEVLNVGNTTAEFLIIEYK